MRLAAFLCLLVLGLAPQASAAGSGAFSLTGSMSVLRYDAAAAPLPDGRVLVAGGTLGPGPRPGYLQSAEVFNPVTGTFSAAGIGSMSVRRAGAVAAPLPDGRVLVAGGVSCFQFQAPFLQCEYLSSAEVFDPVTNTFSSTGIGSMSVPRAGASAAPLPDGRVLVAGGHYYDGSEHYLSSAEVFDPATNTFSSAGIGSMSVPRVYAGAAPLPDGRVLVIGPQNAEIFDPASNSFSSAGIGPTSLRRVAAAAPLPDGRVLLVGVSDGGAPNAEAFDPATGTMSSAGIGSMSVGRLQAVSAPLLDGRVLVIGGPGATAEIFALVSCRGRQGTIVGSPRDDQLTGTRGADVIMGVGGDDKLSGLGGKDLICGGEDDDTVNGGAGNDRLFGQQGNDRLWGRKGRDRLFGGNGNDVLKGGPGKDRLKGGPGKDLEAKEKPARHRH